MNKTLRVGLLLLFFLHFIEILMTTMMVICNKGKTRFIDNHHQSLCFIFVSIFVCVVHVCLHGPVCPVWRWQEAKEAQLQQCGSVRGGMGG